MSISFFDVVKPSFEIDFWMRHVKKLDYFECRAYEEYIMEPLHDDLYFADQIDPDETYEAWENFGYDPIDVIKEICDDNIFSKKEKEYGVPEVLNVNKDEDEYIFIKDEDEEE